MKLLNQIKSYWIFLRRNKLYTAVNVLGLSISLCFCVLLFSYLYSEFTVDDFQDNMEDIFVLGNEESYTNAYLIGEYLQYKMPEIKSTCGIYPKGEVILSMRPNGEEQRRIEKTICVDSSFLDILSFRLLSGEREKVLRSQSGILLSESFALSTFSNINPVGQSLYYTYTPYGSEKERKVEFIVEGVIEDFKNSIFPPTDIIFPRGAIQYFNPSVLSEDFTSCSSTIIFLRRPGTDLQQKEEQVLQWFKKDYWVYKDDCFFGPYKESYFTPMKNLYFRQGTNDFYDDYFRKNDRSILVLFLSVSIVVLVFSIFNYINLTVAQTGFRAKEMAVNKLYGASSRNIRFRMWIESEIMIMIAFIIALLMAFALEADISAMVGQKFYLNENLSFVHISVIVLFMFILGGVNAFIPSYYISRYKPIDVVKGEFIFKNKLLYSKIFIVLQVAITVILIVFSVTMNRQMKHILNFDYGYNYKNIINIDIWDMEGINPQALVSEIGTMPGVKSVGLTEGVPLDRGNNNSLLVTSVNKYVGFQIYKSDISTVKMLGYSFIQDNKSADKNAWWVSEETLRRCELDYDAKEIKTAEYGLDGDAYKGIRIAGVFKDIYSNSISSKEKGYMGYAPMVLKIMDEVEDPWSILVETEIKDGDIINRISKTFKEQGSVAPRMSYIEDSLRASAINDIRVKNIIYIFTFIALVISFLGLFAMATYFSEQATKEIAIRKISGSTSREVLYMMLSRFLILVALAFVIACPIAFYMVNRWLEGFEYKVDIGIWGFLTAGVIIFVISFITVFFQSQIAANANPVERLKK
jgi:putative ABC transport system permease protein